MPSMSIWSEPIIQSIWMLLLLPPCSAISSGVMFAPSRNISRTLAEGDVARGVLVEQRIEEQKALWEIGDEFGTSATSPMRRAPSSVSSPSSAHLRLGGVGLDDPSGFELDLDTLDQRALVGERLGLTTRPSTRAHAAS